MNRAYVIAPSNDELWPGGKGPRDWGDLCIWQTNWGRPRGRNWKWTRGCPDSDTAVAIYGSELHRDIGRWWIEVGVVTVRSGGEDQEYWSRAMFRARTRRGAWRRAARWVELNEATLTELLHKEAERWRTPR